MLVVPIPLCILLLGLLDVRCHEELSKEDKKRQDINNVGSNDTKTCLLASVGQQVGSLTHHCDELD